MDKLHAYLQSLPNGLWVTIGIATLTVLAISAFLYRFLKQRESLENIGLRQMETSIQENPVSLDRKEPGISEDAFDPLEEDFSEDHAFTETTVVTEKEVFEEPVTEKTPPDFSEVPRVFESEPTPEPKIFLKEVPWKFLETLPFRMNKCLRTAHVDMLGIGVEAVFFPPNAINSLSDPLLRLVPFLPDGEILFRESDGKTFRMGSLFAQPDAVIETENGLLSVEYKSKSGRSDNPDDPASTLRPVDLMQTLIEAMVLSVSLSRPVAPILRTHNAVYFLRPERRIMSLIADSIIPAEDFLSPYSRQKGICASDYAAFCSVAARHLFEMPESSLSELGKVAHQQLLD